jgi:hypothetical protein
LPRTAEELKFPQNLRPISLLPSAAKVSKKVILQIVQRQVGARNSLNASQFAFRARDSTDHVTPYFNNNKNKNKSLGLHLQNPLN